MKIILSVIFILGCALTAFGQRQDMLVDVFLLEGTDFPAFHSGNCFVFSKYIIETSGAEVGESITAYQPTAASSRTCNVDKTPILSVPDSDNNEFKGVMGNYLFIDMGTSAGERTLAVFDLAAKRSLAEIAYYGDIKLSGGRYLLYDSLTTKKLPVRSCKKAAEWKYNKDQTVWVQGTKYDLQTKKAVSVGALKCAYAE